MGEFTGIFTNADGNLFVETYNQLNAYFATVPGNYAMNLRRLYLLNSNYADSRFCLRSCLARRRTRISARSTLLRSKPTTARRISSTCITAKLLTRSSWE